MTNCPNCGSPVQGPICEYCGTVFEKEEPRAILYADNIPVEWIYEEEHLCPF